MICEAQCRILGVAVDEPELDSRLDRKPRLHPIDSARVVRLIRATSSGQRESAVK